MKPIVLLAAAAAAAILAASSPATELPGQQAESLVAAVNGVRHTVWACQDHIGQPRTRAALPESRLTLAAPGYLKWMRRVWEGRLTGCERVNGHRIHIVTVLRRGLHGYPLEAWAEAFEQAGRQWDVSPYFMAAISGTESTFGLYVSPENAWGIGPGMAFRDFGEGIQYLARLLATSYNLTSAWTVGPRYAACGSCWGTTTGAIMQSRFGASPYSLRYPHLE